MTGHFDVIADRAPPQSAITSNDVLMRSILQESVISKAEYLCNQAIRILHDDVLAFEHLESDYEADGGDSSNLNKTTLGVMQKQCIVEALLPGSPAEGFLKKGDLIVSVN